MQYSTMDALTTIKGPETGPSAHVSVKAARNDYYRTQGFIKVKMEPQDQLTSADMKYKSAWHMYFVHKNWYAQGLWQQLPNLFTAFIVVDISKAPFRPGGDNAQINGQLQKLCDLCQTHYLLLPILRIKKRRQGDGLDMVFIGMSLPKNCSQSGHWDASSVHFKIYEAYFYGHWFKNGHRSTPRDISNMMTLTSPWAMSHYPPFAKGSDNFHSFYRKHRDEMEQIINNLLLTNLGGVHAD